MGLFDEILGAADCSKCGRPMSIQIKERHPGSFSEWKFRLGQTIPRVPTEEYIAEGVGACDGPRGCSPSDFVCFEVQMRGGAAVSVQRVSNFDGIDGKGAK